MAQQYLNLNRNAWNKRVTHHVASDFYDQEAFRSGKDTLMDIEKPLLGDVNGKKLLHLQCHFGQDTLSLARKGAQVTGLDFSDQAIAQARKEAELLGLEADFVCSDVYSIPDELKGKFDITFTSYGTIGWLPDIQAWGKVVASTLATGGQFVFTEFHPFIWMMDEHFDEVMYDYNSSQPIIEEWHGSYAFEGQDKAHDTIYSWNHGLSQVITALIDAGLTLCHFSEYNWSPYNIFPHMEERQPGQWVSKEISADIPYVYALVARKDK